MKKDYDNSQDVVVNDIAFHKDNNTGYYLSTSKVNGRRVRLHIYLWESLNNCRVPNGFEVHHINFDKDDNRIENLQLLTTHGHRAIHAAALTEDDRERMRRNLETNARPKASIWHKSAAGRAWHKKMAALQSKDRYKRKLTTCAVCGNEFMGIYKSKYCCATCKTKARVLSGVDNTTRICQICGRSFSVNRYYKKTTCSRSCSAELRKRSMACKKQDS